MWTWVRGVNVRKTCIGYVLISRSFEDRLRNLNALRGARGGMSDHYLVEAKLKVKTRYWRGRTEGGGMRGGVEVIKAREIGQKESKKSFRE